MIFSVSNVPLIWTAAVPLAFKLWLKWAVCLSVWNKPSVFLSEMSHLSLWLKWAVYLNSLNTSVECLLINSKNMSQGCLKWQLYKYLCVCVCVCVLVPVHKYTFCVVSWERQDKTYCLLLVGLVVLAVCFCLWGRGGGGFKLLFLIFSVTCSVFV